MQTVVARHNRTYTVYSHYNQLFSWDVIVWKYISLATLYNPHAKEMSGKHDLFIVFA
jgi:hypothetical protein